VFFRAPLSLNLIIKDFAIKQNRYNPPIAAVKEAIDKGFWVGFIVFN
jgi:hypothetical protein